MRDELLGQKRISNESMILNLDDNRGRGTHWTCLFIKNSEAYYFDPFGMPMTKELETYLEGIPTDYSSFSIQAPEEVICGHYCVYMLWRLSLGFNFYEILLELL